MRKIDLAKEALELMWRRKYLWLFGLFAGAGGGGGGNGSSSAGVGPGGAAAGAKDGMPEWGVPLLVGLVALAVVFTIVGVVLHVVSEAALIEGVRRDRTGERLGIRRGFTVGVGYFWRVLGLKVLFVFAFLVPVAVVATPAILGAAEVIPLGAGIAGSVLLALPAVPLLLTVYFLYEFSMRFAVLENRSARESMTAAYRFLHGRIVDSLQLLLIAIVGRMGGALVLVTLLLPVAALAAAAYFTVGIVAAVAVGAVALPLMMAGVGAVGTFTSSVWTLGFLEDRAEATR